MTEKDLDEAMAVMDEDGSGEVDIEEFTLWYMNMAKSELVRLIPDAAAAAAALVCFVLASHCTVPCLVRVGGHPSSSSSSSTPCSQNPRLRASVAGRT